MQIKVDAWYDLVFHGLAHLPVSGDASTIFSPAYVAWVEDGFARYGSPSGGIPRSLRQDAALMASLYAASPSGYLLHSFPLLWDDTDAFMRDMPVAFADLAWQDPKRAAWASAIMAGMHASLPDLFRTALWSEIRNGYEAVWPQTLAERALAYRHFFANTLQSMSEKLPTLRDVRWILSHPLGTHGRGYANTSSGWTIVVGVADPEMGVAAMHPVVQACHELFVLEAGAGRPGVGHFATVPGRAGYESFASVETDALAWGTRFFQDSPWEKDYRAWREALSASG